MNVNEDVDKMSEKERRRAVRKAGDPFDELEDGGDSE